MYTYYTTSRSKNIGDELGTFPLYISYFVYYVICHCVQLMQLNVGMCHMKV